MRVIFALFLLSMYVSIFNAFLQAQAPTTQIEGFLEVYHPEDTTSLYIGKEAGKLIDIMFDYENTFVGSFAGKDNTTGRYNSFFGYGAGFSNTSGRYNSFFGKFAGSAITFGERNSFFGHGAGQYLTGHGNVAIGWSAGPLRVQGVESNKLFIDNVASFNPLIYGEFDNDLITINHSAALSGSGHLRGFRINNTSSSAYWNFYTFNSGTLGLYKTNDGDEKFQFRTNGDFITDGAVNPSSDRNRKEQIVDIDQSEVLKKVGNLPIFEWQYIGAKERHIGPMAQDFYAAFGLGLGETTIATVDADGVALAAIKALIKKNELLESQNEKILRRIAKLESIISQQSSEQED